MTAFDLRGMMRPEDGFAVKVDYLQGADSLPLSITILPENGDGVLSSSGLSLISGAGRFYALIEELPAPAIGDSFTLGGVKWVVQADPLPYAARHMWCLECCHD